MRRSVLFAVSVSIFLILPSCSEKSSNQWELSSPSGELKLTVMRTESGEVRYNLKNGDRTVIEESPMGMEFYEASFTKGLELIAENEYLNRKDNYTMFTGKHVENQISWNEKQFKFSNQQQQEMLISFRLFDDGLAFQYEFEKPEAISYQIKEELTGFKIPTNGYAWMHPYDTISSWSPAYETYYQNKIPVSTESPSNKNGWAFPMLFNTGNDWTLITGANMPEGYTGMMVDGTPENGLYTLLLPKEEEAMGVCSSEASFTLPFFTPWRVIITGDRPGAVVESNMVFHVSEGNVLQDTSWIEPGRAAWSWWSESESPRNFSRLKEFVDFTAEMGWEYFLVDANWSEMRWGNLERLAEYAKNQSVGLMVWYNSGGPHNEVTEQPRDLMHLRETRREEFAKLQQWGIKGIKVDFFQSDKACIMQQYHDILKDAADFELLVNFHGSTIPRGWERTYPNLMTMESVKGAEAYRFASDYPVTAPWHNTILPFTRNVVGSMDYTPVTFSESFYPKTTTHAHELALAVVFESGIQHFADSDESYLSQPDFVIDYLKNVPVAWDDTRLVEGYPGEMVVMARKKNNKWYVSGINGQNKPVDLDLNLDFLSAGSYKFTIIGDGETPAEFYREEKTITRNAKPQVKMLERGGFSSIIEKI